MSYIQVEILGKLRGLKFNQGALMTFKDKTDLSNEQGTIMYALFWAGLKACAHAKEVELTRTEGDKEVPVTFEDVCDAVDLLSVEVQTSVWECFRESVVYQTKLKPLIEDAEKKNHTSTEQPIEQTASNLQEG